MNQQLQLMQNLLASSAEMDRRKIILLCEDIERRLLRFFRGNLEMTAEVLDARAERIKIFGE